MIRGVPYDAEVECLESTGTQWINTGVIANGEFDVEYSISTQSTFNQFIVAGARSATQHLNFGQYVNDGNFVLGYLSEYWTMPMGITANMTYTAEVHYASGSQSAKVNGVSATSKSLTGTEALNMNIYLFKRNFHGDIDTLAPMVGRMYSFKMWQNGVLVRDFQPVRFTNELSQTEGAMYDRVTRRLFRNQGTGAFSWGSDVARPIMGLHFMKPMYTAENYVRDGLIAMWDGIENAGRGVHDASATAWKDLVTGRMMPTTLPSLSWESDALVRTGVDGLSYDSGIDFSDPLSQRTFEFVISYSADYEDTSGYWFIVRMNGIGTHLSFWNRKAFGITLYSGGGILNTSFEQPSFHGSVSLVGTDVVYNENRNVARYYQNGNYFANGAFGGWGTSSLLIQLFAHANWPASNTIKIHCIRLYSRALTAAEIAANYAVDKARFNLPEVTA